MLILERTYCKAGAAASGGRKIEHGKFLQESGDFLLVLGVKKEKTRRRRRPAGGRRGERKGKEGFLKDKEGLDNSGDRDGIRGALVSRRYRVKRTVSLE